MHIYAWQMGTPQSIKHRCLEYHYTKLGRSSRYSKMHIYAWQIYPQSIEHRCLDTTTPNLAALEDIAQCTYMHGRSTPNSIKHRCLEYCYTKLGSSSRYSTIHIYAWQIGPPPGQSSIHAFNTTSPKRLNYLCLLKLHTRETAAVNKPYALPSIHRAAVEGKIVRQKTNATTLLTTCFCGLFHNYKVICWINC